MPYQLRVIMPYTTGLPRDVAMTTWNLTTSEAQWNAGTTMAQWQAHLVSFFNTAHTGSFTPLSGYLSPILSRVSNACRIESWRIDDLDGSVMTQVNEFNFTLGASAATQSIPLEVAICSSFQSGARLIPGSWPVNRRRGRVYLGPWNSLAVDTTAGAIPRPLVDLRTSIANGTRFLAEAGSEEKGYFAVWSRAQQQLRQVDRGWVDAAWDTQRRREVDSDSRVLWSL